MNTLNFINIIKMSNIIVDFKRFLTFFIPEEKLYEINILINEFNKSYFPGVNIKKKIRLLNELRALKKEIICKDR